MDLFAPPDDSSARARNWSSSSRDQAAARNYLLRNKSSGSSISSQNTFNGIHKNTYGTEAPTSSKLTDVNVPEREQLLGPADHDAGPPSPPPEESLRIGFKGSVHEIWDELTVKNCLASVPAVAMGTILNVLDGLSYGMILFPLGRAAFAGLESAGLAMFYVSTIVGQLVLTLGGSNFPSCVGSEMIEVVPFFHSMALTIADRIGSENPQALLATTITTYALSSIITGLVFLLLGWVRMGALVGFFPRHILVGSIGGVGVFLILTGFEVAARLEGRFEFTIPAIKHLFEHGVWEKWSCCLLLCGVLLYAERRFHNPIAVPTILAIAFASFYVICAAMGISLNQARESGWLFPMQDSSAPWYEFYSFYRFDLVDWGSILATLPAMLALTFFGLIHVPINIPALAASTNADDIDVNQELIAHGISNTLSGMVGSIQNYLVYTNSLLFIRCGATTRLPGLLLALATCVVMMIGPASIGFVPVCVVAALIFMMGVDLAIEALVDTWGKVKPHEYATIIAIVLTMGVYDFVVGIIVGIVLACLLFVVMAARNNPIRAKLTGETVRSTVNRHPILQKFLNRVGNQISVIKLSGSLFFGTTVQIERGIRTFVSDPTRSLKFVIIDLEHVTDIDFSSTDAFERVKRFLDARNIDLVFSGLTKSGAREQVLMALDFVQEAHTASGGVDPTKVNFFADLNTALEFCEDRFLSLYYKYRDHTVGNERLPAPIRTTRTVRSDSRAPVMSSDNLILGVSVDSGSIVESNTPLFGATPRGRSVKAAAKIVDQDFKDVPDWHDLKQPMPIILQVVDGLSTRDRDFWYQLVPYLDKVLISPGEIVIEAGTQSPGFFFIESGILQTHFPQHPGLIETILPGTAFGESSFFSGELTSTQIRAVTGLTLWRLDQASYQRLLSSPQGPQISAELMKVGLCITRGRLNTIVSYLRVLST